jgi:hypothetical protein
MFPEPSNSTPHTHTLPSQFPKVQFWSHHPIYALFFLAVLSFKLSDQKLTCFSLLFHVCHLSLLQLICLMISRNEHNLWSSSLCNFLHSSITFFIPLSFKCSS